MAITISVDDRRRLFAARHQAKSFAAEDTAEALAFVHATDPASVYLQFMARSVVPSVAEVDRVLFDDRSYFRMLAMRRTLWLVRAGEAMLVHAGAGRAIAKRERERLNKWLAESGVARPEAWMKRTSREVLEVVSQSDGGIEAREISKLVPALQRKILVGGGTRNSAEVNPTSRLLGVLAAEGVLVRGRVKGSWTNRIYNWHVSEWLGQNIANSTISESDGICSIVRSYIRAFGPVTFTDVCWFTGLGKRVIARAIVEAGVDEIELENADTGLVINNDFERHRELLGGSSGDPVVSLLPALDAAVMAYKQRDWYLGDNASLVFDTLGNAGPTVWIDGHLVGVWAKTTEPTPIVALLPSAPIDGHQELAIQSAAEALGSAVGTTAIKPSFPTPLQKLLQNDQTLPSGVRLISG